MTEEQNQMVADLNHHPGDIDRLWPVHQSKLLENYFLPYEATKDRCIQV
jgi:hypothetical protein